MFPDSKSADVPSSFNCTQSFPVNDTPLYRLLVLSAVSLLKHVRPYKGRVLMISRSLCIKYSPLVHLSEASTMHYISSHTSIPVPKVFCAFQHRGWTYILMERIHGDKVGSGWLNRSIESKANILSQLRKMVQEMRGLTSPPGCGVANVDGGSLYDRRIPRPSLRFGPFSGIQRFPQPFKRRHLSGSKP